MLKTEKNIVLNGRSMVGEVSVVYLTANISTEISPMNAPAMSVNIGDPQTYIANKEECRKDIENFTIEAYKIQDEFFMANEGGTK